MGKICILKELLSFMRIENGLFIGSISISGFLIFNRPNAMMLPLFVAMFLGTMASYAYNYLKDTEEDLVNKSKLNRYVIKPGQGRAVVLSLYLSGLLASVFLSRLSFAVYLLLTATSVLYSGWFRSKERFVVKNAHTGGGIAVSFLVGSAANGLFSMSMLTYVGAVFILGFAANVLGDIRGSKGDRSIGMTTIPILLGEKKGKRFVMIMLSLFMAAVAVMGQSELYPLLPFVGAAVIMLFKGMMKGTRISILSSFVFLPFFLIASGF